MDRTIQVLSWSFLRVFFFSFSSCFNPFRFCDFSRLWDLIFFLFNTLSRTQIEWQMKPVYTSSQMVIPRNANYSETNDILTKIAIIILGSIKIRWPWKADVDPGSWRSLNTISFVPGVCFVTGCFFSLFSFVVFFLLSPYIKFFSYSLARSRSLFLSLTFALSLSRSFSLFLSLSCTWLVQFSYFNNS